MVGTRRVYLDASAIVKAIVTELESPALTRYLAQADLHVSSRIVAVEVSRAVARRDRSLAARSDEVLGAIQFVELDEAIARSAAQLDPPTLRSLDAIHLASAMSIGSDLDALITYDLRLADAARAAGLAVVTPA